MDGAARQVIEQSNRDAFSGRISFGAEIGSLMMVGVESYLVDYRARTVTYYMPDDQCCLLPMTVPDVAIPRVFDNAALIAVIRSAQSGAIGFPAFVAQSMAAGCVGYIVWITGQQTGYLGRKGVAYTELFQGAA
ncbi:DUF1398 domain-containing protein [Silvimonas iriomotensis]|uniref:DUF1398 domain-containing protein n=1 Tax=Silvimonas iriomotensis TaxID=449662 RepID=A0ABQ2P5Y8_9NEIS|nr:DUF1398 domain-containing protein [Silvimonas iriomotensis]GGP18845.1 hypothetical protein GCM10010970_07680 [Silvimonas iriomotensis]